MSVLEGITVYDALEKGFDDLVDLCDVVIDKFTVARDDFNQRQQVRSFLIVSEHDRRSGR